MFEQLKSSSFYVMCILFPLPLYFLFTLEEEIWFNNSFPFPNIWKFYHVSFIDFIIHIFLMLLIRNSILEENYYNGNSTNDSSWTSSTASSCIFR